MQRAGVDGRSTGDRLASSRYQERHDSAAGTEIRQSRRHRHQTRLGAERRPRQAQDLRQYLRPLSKHGQRHRIVEMDCRAIRREFELERRRMGQEFVARQAHSQRHSRRRGRPHRRRNGSGGIGGIQSRRAPARWRAVFDLGTSADRRCARFGNRDHVRRRNSLWAGYRPRASRSVRVHA